MAQGGQQGGFGWGQLCSVKVIVQMCKAQDRKGYERPEKQQGKLEECMAEQIRECHGDVKGHPCMNQNKLSLA